MRIGMFLAYWPWFSFEEQVKLSRLGDEVRLDSVWISEAWGHDAVSVLGYLAAKTERIALGSALMQIPARQPTATAMAAVGLDVVSGGRFRLGLGLSGPQVSEGWYGVPFDSPIGRTREYVEIVRAALKREPVVHDGKHWTLPLPADQGLGLGKPLRLLATPVQQRIPIYLGAIGPQAVRQTGEIADGWLPFLLDPEEPEVLLEHLRDGLDRSDRSITDMDISPCAAACVADTIDEARDACRPLVSFYIGGMGAPKKNFYLQLAEQYGDGSSAHEVHRRWLAGDRAGAAAAVSDELIDRTSICATPDTLESRLARYEAMGATSLLAIPFGNRDRTVRALAEARGIHAQVSTLIAEA